jgi:hypothetical protein
MVYDHVLKNSRFAVHIFEEKKWDSDKNEWLYPKHRKLSHFEINPIGSNRTIADGHISKIGIVWMLSNSAGLATKVETFIKNFEKKFK